MWWVVSDATMLNTTPKSLAARTAHTHRTNLVCSAGGGQHKGPVDDHAVVAQDRAHRMHDAAEGKGHGSMRYGARLVHISFHNTGHRTQDTA